MMASPVVVLREKLVDETDWILPTSFLALDQSLPLGIASTGSAAFSFMTIDLRSDTVLTVGVVHFGRFPFVPQNQLPQTWIICEFVDH